jgi:hypothetical protein
VEKDEEDSSVTRPPELLKSIFASANLELFKVTERKNLKIFHVVPIFTELAPDLTHLAHKENTQSNIFLWDRREL